MAPDGAQGLQGRASLDARCQRNPGCCYLRGLGAGARPRECRLTAHGTSHIAHKKPVGQEGKASTLQRCLSGLILELREALGITLRGLKSGGQGMSRAREMSVNLPLANSFGQGTFPNWCSVPRPVLGLGTQINQSSFRDREAQGSNSIITVEKDEGTAGSSENATGFKVSTGVTRNWRDEQGVMKVFPDKNKFPKT